MELTSKQRAQLRGMAANLDTIVHVGKDGIGDNLVKQVSDALEARELIKGRVLENSMLTAREAAEELKASMLTRCCGETRESNLAMRRVFERCGYRLNKTEESYYENPTESACKYVLRREELE